MIEAPLKFPHRAWESREQFIQHFSLWVSALEYSKSAFKTRLTLLREAYRNARTTYYPRGYV